MMKRVFNVANGDRPHVPDTAIVITDGRSTYDSNLTIPYAEEAKRRGIKIIGLYIASCFVYTDISHSFISLFKVHIEGDNRNTRTIKK